MLLSNLVIWVLGPRPAELEVCLGITPGRTWRQASTLPALCTVSPILAFPLTPTPRCQQDSLEAFMPERESFISGPSPDVATGAAPGSSAKDLSGDESGRHFPHLPPSFFLGSLGLREKASGISQEISGKLVTEPSNLWVREKGSPFTSSFQFCICFGTMSSGAWVHFKQSFRGPTGVLGLGWIRHLYPSVPGEVCAFLPTPSSPYQTNSS